MIIHKNDHEVRYRVYDITAAHEDDETYTVAFSFESREYKTLHAAEQRVNRLADQGRVGLLQVGVMAWMNPSEAAECMDMLSREGVTWR